ncbi:MAG: Nif11-like leader peptide family natural product precursor [Elusimicrobiota bacterium]
MHEKKGWNVFDRQGTRVLWMKDEPGRLLSTALPPPGAKSPSHPFLTAQAFVPGEENRLRELLERSKDFDEYVVLLRENGYTVTAEE